MFNTPILFLIFNRPDTTEEVFKKIKLLKPKHLYIGADGPRINKPDDQLLCEKTRAIVSDIDWPCEVKTLFNAHNLGCGLAPATAITWFFEQVDEGIILEDDCLPNNSFFDYCEQLLAHYSHNDKVMMVCGTSYQPASLNEDTYYFSKYPHVWGWATWKRAWAKYNFKLDGESEQVKASVMKATFSSNRERNFWRRNMQMIVNGLDAWDYQLMYWMWKNDGVCIVPWKNMIANIGFGTHGTHTIDAASIQSKMAQFEISAIKHPSTIIVNSKADEYERYNILIGSDFQYYLIRFRSVLNRISKLLTKKNE